MAVDLLPGTLDLLILKAVSLGPQHGYGILLRIEQISRGQFPIQQGTLYPALYRLEDRGLLSTEWGTRTTTGARSSTPSRRLAETIERRTSKWADIIAGMAAAFGNAESI